MREIKFRAWDDHNKAMKYYTLKELAGEDKFGYDTEFEAIQSGFDNWIWMQFTGLHDKNGKEVYEGDILSYKSAHPKHEGKIFNNVVEFASGQSLCGWRMRNGKCVVKATPYKFGSSEIIGNIYENPELLTK